MRDNSHDRGLYPEELNVVQHAAEHFKRNRCGIIYFRDIIVEENV